MQIKVNDSQLERAINALFSDVAIKEAIATQAESESEYIKMDYMRGDVCLGSLTFAKALICAFQKYDPSRWNEYPYVEPPEGVWMRAEIEAPRGTFRLCLKYEDGNWKDMKGETFYGVSKFRPWSDL